MLLLNSDNNNKQLQLHQQKQQANGQSNELNNKIIFVIMILYQFKMIKSFYRDKDKNDLQATFIHRNKIQDLLVFTE